MSAWGQVFGWRWGYSFRKVSFEASQRRGVSFFMSTDPSLFAPVEVYTSKTIWTVQTGLERFEKEDTNWTGREARRWIWEELGVRNERDQNTLYGILTKQNFKIMKHFVCVQIWAHAGVEQHCAKEKINGQRASPKRTGEDSLSMKTATPNGVLLYWMSADKS